MVIGGGDSKNIENRSNQIDGEAQWSDITMRLPKYKINIHWACLRNFDC